MSSLLTLVESFVRAKKAVGTTPADTILAENKWRLLRYRARADQSPRGAPVLLVPSLINRHYVLDLLPGRSFAEFLVGEGHDVYIIDWGTPSDEDRFLTFDTICDRYLGRAVRCAARTSGQDQVHLLGYCLGGTLTTIYAAAHPERIASLANVAAPIRFHDGGLLSAWTRTPGFRVGALVDALGNVPWPLMQASFHMLKPTLNLVKGLQLIERASDDEFLNSFFAIETWGNDNVSFPGECYRRYIEELYRKDALINDAFSLSGRPVRLGAIRCPTLVVTFEHDYIVPPDSAAILLERISAEKKERIHLQGGHVGAMISKKALGTLWPKLSAFWRSCEASGEKAEPPVREAPREPRRAPVPLPRPRTRGAKR